jgi:hypothetical protein
MAESSCYVGGMLAPGPPRALIHVITPPACRRSGAAGLTSGGVVRDQQRSVPAANRPSRGRRQHRDSARIQPLDGLSPQQPMRMTHMGMPQQEPPPRR